MMYADWASVKDDIQASCGHQSVLCSYPDTVGREVASQIVHTLAPVVSKSNEEDEPSKLTTDAAVKWTMQALCYGLTLPMSDYDTIRECVSIYCEWLTCLTSPKKCVPIPILEDRNAYAQEILNHLYNIFVPRLDSVTDQVSRQAVLCHRVLKTVQHSVTNSSILTNQTWDCLLRFLLAINDVLLAPPAEKDSIGSQLCERVLSVLFEIWILACCRCFPSPSLWKTLKEMCSSWRHHEALVIQWHRINVAFTSRLLKVIYGNNVCGLQLTDEDERLIPDGVSCECIVQCWFRFLHILGNPVELSRPSVITNTPKFLHMALTSEVPVEPEDHECLKTLPYIFYRAMKSVAVVADAFLGITHRDTTDSDWLLASLSSKPSDLSAQPAASTPPSHRRPRPSFLLPHTSKATKDAGPRPSLSETWTAPSSVATIPGVSVATSENSMFSPCRPTVNSLLHLLGSWLLEASLVGVRVYGSSAKVLRSRTASLHMDSDPARIQSQLDHSLTDDIGGLLDGSYEMGRAQACGTLCRIFCSHKTGEAILPIYTSRFYVSLYYGLQVFSDTKSIPVVLASVISNASDLLRLDLDGIHVLLPQILAALEDLQPRFRYKHDNVDEDADLRHASIHLLLSAICLPLQFGNLPIRAILDDQRMDPKVSFISLKKRLTELLQKLLMSETDSVNTQMLLGGLVVCVLDQALYEEINGDLLCDSSHPVQEFFGQFASLVCNRLMASWKGELGCALAAMEVLSAFARIKFKKPNTLYCKRIVNWICEFVVFQCKQPAPAHSKDLHSMIVMAFRCLSIWLMEHDYLMQDKECLQTVLQVVELGISGSMSQPRASDVPRVKGDKELKPVSMRVRDAAEALLTAIIDYVGSFPPPCGPESLCTLLDEESLLKHCDGKSTDACLPDSGVPFQYFVLDGSTIIGLLERPVGSSGGEPLPTVTAIVRGAFGRHAWTMQLRHHPRSFRSDARNASVAPVSSAVEPKIPPRMHHQYFPDIVKQIPPVLADQSIPRLESTMSEYQAELNKLQALVTKQVESEQTCIQNHAKQPKPVAHCTEPSSCREFQTARLFLTHYGFLTLDGLKTGSMSGMVPSLVRLNGADVKLWNDLKQLDGLSVRTADTVHVFYVKAGQTRLIDMLQNVMQRRNVQDHFLEFLRSLGWPVDVEEHSGWTGSVATSWKVKGSHSEEKSYPADTGGSLYDGRQQVLYWSDVSTEVAFVVPSTATYPSSADGEKPSVQVTASASSLCGGDQISLAKLKSLSLDLDNVPTVTDAGQVSRLKRSGRSGLTSFCTDIHVIVVWLESYEDHLSFPLGDALKICQESKTSVGAPPTVSSSQKHSPPIQSCIIFVHPLHNGLFRIHFQAQQTRVSEAVPLVDGMVVSRRLLGHLVRQTSVNIFRRRQLDSELYQPPHVRRKLKIKDIVEKYQCKLTESEFYTSLFQDAPTSQQQTISTNVA